MVAYPLSSSTKRIFPRTNAMDISVYLMTWMLYSSGIILSIREMGAASHWVSRRCLWVNGQVASSLALPGAEPTLRPESTSQSHLPPLGQFLCHG